MVAQGPLAALEEGLLAATASVLMAQAKVVASPVEMRAVLTAWAAPPVQVGKGLVAVV